MPEGKCFFPFRGKNELFGLFLKYESLIDVVFTKDKQMKGERKLLWLLGIGK